MPPRRTADERASWHCQHDWTTLSPNGDSPRDNLPLPGRACPMYSRHLHEQMFLGDPPSAPKLSVPGRKLACASRRLAEGSSHSFSLSELSSRSSIAKELARELVLQTEVITVRNPSLAVYVRVVSVVLTEWCTENVYPEFFSSLSLLPNLSTLQILLAPDVFHKTLRSTFRSSIPNPMDGALAGRVFPTVRTLALHRSAFDLVRCCPNVERLTLLGSFSGLSPVQRRSLKEDAPHLRVFTCRPVPAGHVEALAELMPLLYEIPPIRVFALAPPPTKRVTFLNGPRSSFALRKWSCAAVVPIHTVTTDMYPYTSPEALSEIVLRIGFVIPITLTNVHLWFAVLVFRAIPYMQQGISLSSYTSSSPTSADKIELPTTYLTFVSR
ncbi:hypothetical protein DFH09DRAFT_1071736 [Mycena vulgaris]|nr:hypothetical protein DFH09DRAFT_1071736 [Mycena vulgaris]